MLKKIIRNALKALAAVVCFGLIFCCLQPFFIPKFIDYNAETTVLVGNFRQLEENSLDVLFLGSSQLFRSVDTQRLYDAYGISAYNYGASGQSMSITPYYFKEALKTQSPKLVAVEVGCIFNKNSELTEREIAWNYAPTPLTKEKLASLEQVFGSKSKACLHAFFPLLVYHDRWRTLGEPDDGENGHDIEYVFHPEHFSSLYPRGFVGLDIVNRLEYDYDRSDSALKEIPEESRNAIESIAKECRERDIRLLFFKTPAPIWTRGESRAVKQFMDAHTLDYIDLNAYAAEMALNENTDFSDEKHLNTSGAEKVTDFVAGMLPQYIES